MINSSKVPYWLFRLVLDISYKYNKPKLAKLVGININLTPDELKVWKKRLKYD